MSRTQPPAYDPTRDLARAAEEGTPRRRASDNAPKINTVSIVIPVYNEEKTIHEIIGRVLEVRIQPDVKRQIICVNDASADGTRQKLDELPALFPEADFTILHKDVNQGKGAALRDGFTKATGDVVLIQDADLEYDPSDYWKLLQPIIDGKADVVYGSRFIGEPHRVLYFWHTLGNKFLTSLSNAFTNLNLTDMEVCYKVFRREIIQGMTLKSDRFGFEPEVTAKIAKHRPRLRIYEVGVAYYGRSYEEGKKITWKDGFNAIYCIVKYRFTD